jgi:catechol 2,3-dioxygenase-like lactoylglutathione lyase family enzyme
LLHSKNLIAMKIIDISFFAYAVSDIKAARAFYEGVLGLTPNSEYDGANNASWIEYDIGLRLKTPSSYASERLLERIAAS